MEPEMTGGQSSAGESSSSASRAARAVAGRQKWATASGTSGGMIDLTMEEKGSGYNRKGTHAVAHKNVFLAFPDDFDMTDLS